MIAAKMENMPHGGNRKNQDANLHVVSREKAASSMNVSERSVATAKTVQEFGVPELSKSVETGKMAVSDAAKVARMEQRSR